MINVEQIVMIFNYERNLKLIAFFWAAIPLSEDHKPNRTDERRRIENAGGVVMWAGKISIMLLLMMLRTAIPVGELGY